MVCSILCLQGASVSPEASSSLNLLRKSQPPVLQNLSPTAVHRVSLGVAWEVAPASQVDLLHPWHVVAPGPVSPWSWRRHWRRCDCCGGGVIHGCGCGDGDGGGGGDGDGDVGAPWLCE